MKRRCDDAADAFIDLAAWLDARGRLVRLTSWRENRKLVRKRRIARRFLLKTRAASALVLARLQAARFLGRGP